MGTRADAEVNARSREEPIPLTTEHRFPLGLAPELPAIWELYEEAKAEPWDPEEDSWVSTFDAGVYSAEALAGAALTWSRRAWLEFTGLAESEALVVRLCLEPGREVDAKFCLSARATEKARSTDASRILAALFERYHVDSPSSDLQELLDGDLIRRALHGAVDVDAYIIGHLCFQASVDLALWEAIRDAAREPAVVDITDAILRDKRRQTTFGWSYLDVRNEHLSDEQRGAAATTLIGLLDNEELRGLRVTALLPPGAGRDQLNSAQMATAAAGLGAVPPDDEIEVLRSSVADVRRRLSALGIEFPRADHRDAGSF